MNHRVLVNKEREKLGPAGTVPLPVYHRSSHTGDFACGERGEARSMHFGRFYCLIAGNYAPTFTDRLGMHCSHVGR